MFGGTTNVLGSKLGWADTGASTIGPSLPVVSTDDNFSIYSVAGLEAYYSTKDPADITVATGVQLWRDRSGKSNETLLACDGTNQATFTNGPVIGTGDFSVSVWLNVSNIVGVHNVMGEAAGTPLVQVEDGYFEVFQRGVVTPGNANIQLTLYTPTHCAYTRTGTSGKYYINGVAAGTQTDTGNYSVAPSIIFGAAVGTRIGQTLQRPAIWNRALSAGEVAALYAAGGVPVAGDYNTASNTSLITGDNSTFASDTGWWSSNPAGVIAAGVCTLNNGQYIDRTALLVVGKKYRYSVDVKTVSSSALRLTDGVATIAQFNSTGIKTGEFTATGTLFRVAEVNGTSSFDDITLYPLGLLAYWDFSGATRGATSVTDTSGNSCVLTTSTGARISGARDYFQGAATNQPAYDSATQTITADGVDNYLKTAPFPLVQPIWICGVMQQVTWTDTDALLDGFAAASGSVIQSTTTPQINLTAGSSVAANTGLAVGTTAILTAVISGADSLLQINAGQPTTGNTGAGNMNGLTLFASGTPALYANALCKEYAVFSRKPSEADRLRVIRFFARRCNISLT